jgi:hypothetical protein
MVEQSAPNLNDVAQIRVFRRDNVRSKRLDAVVTVGTPLEGEARLRDRVAKLAADLPRSRSSPRGERA